MVAKWSVASAITGNDGVTSVLLCAHDDPGGEGHVCNECGRGCDTCSAFFCYDHLRLQDTADDDASHTYMCDGCRLRSSSPCPCDDCRYSDDDASNVDMDMRETLDCVEIPTIKKAFTYTDIHDYVASLSIQIKRDFPSLATIVAIGGGGFVPARLMRSHLKLKIIAVSLERYLEDGSGILDVPNVLQWIYPNTPEAEQLKQGPVLIIDECYDKGNTLNFVADKLVKDGLVQKSNVFCAVIHKKDNVPGQMSCKYPLLWSTDCRQRLDNVSLG